MEKQSANDKSVQAVGIGFFLIILAAMLIFVRQHPLENGDAKHDVQNQSVGEKISSKIITSGELAKKIMQDPDLSIIDLRSKDEFDREHIQKSKNIQIESLRFIEKDKTYVFVSDELSVDQLNVLEKTLEEDGIENYFYLAGGFLAWKNAYNPTVSAGDANSLVDQAKVSYLTNEELKNLLDTDKNLFIIDLRSSVQFSEGHIRSAINIPLENLESKEESIPAGKKIILYDNDQTGAFKASVRLYDLGIFGARALSDGFSRWKEKGYEIIK